MDRKPTKSNTGPLDLRKRTTQLDQTLPEIDVMHGCSDPRIRIALDMLERECDKMLPVGVIASRVNLSNSRFSHLFRQEMGVAPGRFTKLFRLEQARRLLRESFMSVKEIAAFVGVNDVSHFVRDYKEQYGETPKHTRLGIVPAGQRKRSNFR